MIIFQENFNNLVEMFNISTRDNIPFIFPTDTIYGIGAPISSIIANTEIYNIKKRPTNKPFPILVGSFEQAEVIADFSSLKKENYDFFKENYDKYATFIINAKDINPFYTTDNKVAIRIPSKKVLANAILEFGIPITATSVNLSGENFENDFKSIINKFNDLKLFTYGKCNLNINSSIYDISGDLVKKIR